VYKNKSLIFHEKNHKRVQSKNLLKTYPWLTYAQALKNIFNALWLYIKQYKVSLLPLKRQKSVNKQNYKEIIKQKVNL